MSAQPNIRRIRHQHGKTENPPIQLRLLGVFPCADGGTAVIVVAETRLAFSSHAMWNRIMSLLIANGQRVLRMSMQPIYYRLKRAIALGILIIFPAVFCASCSTGDRSGGQSGSVAASKSTDPAAAKKAAERRRWAERVQRDNELAPGGSTPGYYGSFGPRFTW